MRRKADEVQQGGSGPPTPALGRPAGRIDRKIEFPMPDEKTKRRIFNIHTSRMTLAEDVNLEELIMTKDELSGADIKVRRPPTHEHGVLFLAALTSKAAGLGVCVWRKRVSRPSAPRRGYLRCGNGA